MNEEKKTIIAHIIKRLFAPEIIEFISLSNVMEYSVFTEHFGGILRDNPAIIPRTRFEKNIDTNIIIPTLMLSKRVTPTAPQKKAGPPR